MTHGNNYSFQKDLQAVQEELMDIVARSIELDRRNATVDEKKLLLETAAEKYQAISLRLHEHRDVVDSCLEMLEAVEERITRLAIELISFVEHDSEYAHEIRGHAHKALKIHDRFYRTNLQPLKEFFSRKGASA